MTVRDFPLFRSLAAWQGKLKRSSAGRKRDIPTYFVFVETDSESVQTYSIASRLCITLSTLCIISDATLKQRSQHHHDRQVLPYTRLVTSDKDMRSHGSQVLQHAKHNIDKHLLPLSYDFAISIL